MTTHEHLLACLAEEGGEVTQEATKALRFGLDDTFSGETVQTRLARELNDLIAVAGLCEDAGLLPPDWFSGMAQFNKKRKVQHFMAYARQRGTLVDPQPVEAA